MAIKKLRVQPQPMLIPEGLYALPTPLLLYQKGTELLWGNPAFEKEFGVAVSDRFVTKNPLHLIRERPVTFPLFTMIGRHEGFVLENLQRKKVPVELRVSATEQDCFLIMIEDVSTKVTLEKQLIENHLELQRAFEQLRTTQNALVQTAKLASLGELSSGIAHELNQPLQAIMGFSQELEHLEKLSPTGKEFLTDIINASRKMAEIIKSLRSFAREAGEELSEISVDHAVKEATKLIHHQLMQKGIEIELKMPTTLPLVTANSIQLEQVFLNILGNARDAIEQAGKKNGKIEVEITAVHDGICARFKDNGCGMDEKTKEKIFDPFFTTKEVGKGTGLGMSISYGILQKIDAKVQVNSKVGEGSEFTITIPTHKKIKEQTR